MSSAHTSVIPPIPVATSVAPHINATPLLSETSESFTYVLPANPRVQSPDIDDPQQQVINVTISWDSHVLYSEHIATPFGFTLGRAAPARGFSFGKAKHLPGSYPGYLLPEALLGQCGITLLGEVDGKAVLFLSHLPRQAQLTLNGSPSEVAALQQAAQRAGYHCSLHKAYYWPLDGCPVRLRLDRFSIDCQVEHAGKAVPRALFSRLDSETLTYFGLSVAAVGSLLASAAFFTPPLHVTAGEGIDRNDLIQMQQYLDAAAEREREPQPEPASDSSEASSGQSGQRAEQAEGSMGDTTSAQRNRRYAVKGPTDNPDPHLARQAALSEAAAFGMIGLLASANGDPNAPTAPWGREASLGLDSHSALGGMWGDEIGASFGGGALGLSGVGSGGGGPGQGIGVGNVGTFSRGMGNTNEYGFGAGHGRATGTHKTRAPRVGQGKVNVSGRLPPEVIRRIVRQNHGRFRLCYERGLGANPSLEGRVNVRFVIGRNGAVSNAANAGSSLGNSEVVGCVIRAFYGLSFPKPEGGLVTVSYPLAFSPG